MSLEFMQDEADPGRICVGKSKHGDAPAIVHLKVSYRRIYQLQRFIEDEIPKGGAFAQIKGLCFLYETLEKVMRINAPDILDLEIPGRMVFEFQRYLEDQIRKGGDFFRARWLVVLYEEIRTAYADRDLTLDVGT